MLEGSASAAARVERADAEPSDSKDAIVALCLCRPRFAHPPPFSRPPPQRNHARRQKETSASLQARDAARALKWKRRSEMAAERAALRQAAAKP